MGSHEADKFEQLHWTLDGTPEIGRAAGVLKRQKAAIEPVEGGWKRGVRLPRA
jgi:hypothetical protein